jgi:hypothetical protein
VNIDLSNVDVNFQLNRVSHYMSMKVVVTVTRIYVLMNRFFSPSEYRFLVWMLRTILVEPEWKYWIQSKETCSINDRYTVNCSVLFFVLMRLLKRWTNLRHKLICVLQLFRLLVTSDFLLVSNDIDHLVQVFGLCCAECS